MKKSIKVILLTAAFTSMFTVVSFAQDMTKDQWSAKVKTEKSITNHLCAADAFLLTCTTPYNDNEKGQVTLDQAGCIEIADYLVNQMLNDGKSGGQKGRFYHQLPETLQPYNQEKQLNRLSKMVADQIFGVLKQQGSSMIREAQCAKKLSLQYVVK